MMKLRRLIASMLALLLAVSLLPMAAMADDLPNNTKSQVLINQPIGTNSGSGVGIAENGSVQTNTGSIAENEGTVSTNNGKIVENKQTVENNVNVSSDYKHLNEQSGYIDTNKGTVTNNGVEDVPKGNYSGYVKDNQGTIENNYGTVNTNKDIVVTNACHVENNNGTVTTNHGTIANNRSNQNTTAKVETNAEGGTVDANYGVITTNDGRVFSNQSTGKIDTNNGTVSSNHGTVETNTIDGKVTNKSIGSNGTVNTNYGTVVDKTSGDEKTYYGLSWGDDIQNLTLINGKMPENADPVNLNDYAAKASLSGYRMTGYTAFARRNGADSQISDTTNHLMDVPVWLKIDWEKIVSIFKPAASNEPEAKPVKVAAIPSTVKAEDVKVGTVVRVKGQLFRVIEMDDGSMTVVTMGKLSKKDMEDLMAFMSKYFTPEQIELLLGDPELISGELAEQLFGGNTGHIVFKAEKNLFA